MAPGLESCFSLCGPLQAARGCTDRASSAEFFRTFSQLKKATTETQHPLSPHCWKGAPPRRASQTALPGCVHQPALLHEPIVSWNARGRVETWDWQLLRKPRVVERTVAKASGSLDPHLKDLLPHLQTPSHPTCNENSKKKMPLLS